MCSDELRESIESGVEVAVVHFTEMFDCRSFEFFISIARHLTNCFTKRSARHPNDICGNVDFHASDVPSLLSTSTTA